MRRLQRRLESQIGTFNNSNRRANSPAASSNRILDGIAPAPLSSTRLVPCWRDSAKNLIHYEEDELRRIDLSTGAVHSIGLSGLCEGRLGDLAFRPLDELSTTAMVGDVVDGEGLPISNARVTARLPDAGLNSTETRSEADGSFRHG